MKTTLDISHQGTMGSAGRTRMTFDENSVAHLMSVLTDLYSDPAMAVVREYSTNALDSHVRAGVTKPVEVSTPTALHQFFTVTDHGEGMTRQQIETEFSKYGWSSNRDSDDTTGMLGLGCKAGLSYTFQFTVDTVKDGIETVVLVTRDEDGAGSVQILSEKETSQPNGTTVEVPVSNIHIIQDRVDEFFKYWDVGTVLVDGKSPRSVWDAPISKLDLMTDNSDNENDLQQFRVDEDIVVTDMVAPGKFKIVMGGVAYPVDLDVLQDETVRFLHNWDMGMAVRVPIGSVNFTPAREALNYTKRTKDCIEIIRLFMQDRVAHTIRAYIDDQPDHFAAFDAFRKLRNRQVYVRQFLPSKKSIKYRDEVIPTHVNFEAVEEDAFDRQGNPVWDYSTKGTETRHWSLATGVFGPPPPVRRTNIYQPMVFNPDWWGSKSWTQGTCSLIGAKNDPISRRDITQLQCVGLVVTNVRTAQVSQAQKRKIQRYCEMNGLLTYDVSYHKVMPCLDNKVDYSKVGMKWEQVLLLPTDKLHQVQWWLRPGVKVVDFQEVNDIVLLADKVTGQTVIANTVDQPKAGVLRTAGALVDSHRASFAEIPDDGSADITAWIDSKTMPYTSKRRVNLENWLESVGYTKVVKSGMSNRQVGTRFAPQDMTFVWCNAREYERFQKFYPNVPSLGDWAVSEINAWQQRRPTRGLVEAKISHIPYRSSKKPKSEFSGQQAGEVLRALAFNRKVTSAFMDPDIRRLLYLYGGLRTKWADMPDGWNDDYANAWVRNLDHLHDIATKRYYVNSNPAYASSHEVDKTFKEISELLEVIWERYKFFAYSDGWGTMRAGHSRLMVDDSAEDIKQSAIAVLNSVYLVREGLHLLPIS